MPEGRHTRCAHSSQVAGTSTHISSSLHCAALHERRLASLQPWTQRLKTVRSTLSTSVEALVEVSSIYSTRVSTSLSDGRHGVEAYGGPAEAPVGDSGCVGIRGGLRAEPCRSRGRVRRFLVELGVVRAREGAAGGSAT